MFTGIIEHCARIADLDVNPGRSARLRIEFADADAAASLAAGLQLGSSIAVNGCCLTVAELTANSFAADLSPETMRRTSFAEARIGSVVNLERPLRAGSELGGHFVQGHVDGIGRVARLFADEPEGHPDRAAAACAEPHKRSETAGSQAHSWWLGIRVPEALRRYVAEKGSLAVHGVSLTVARCQDGIAEFAVIPFTYQHTNIRQLTLGDAVNLECDILAKYVESLLAPPPAPAMSRLTVSRLTEEGF